MGIAEIEPPSGGSPSLFDMPLWLLILLALVWAFFVWREPKNGGPNPGWYVPPTVITVLAVIVFAGLSHWA